LHAARLLREANERLIVAALQAQSDFQTAARELGDATRIRDTDALTGLANRNVLFERLILASAKTQELGRPLAVLFIDLNGFKQINDTHGHAAGDHVLKESAQRLLALTRTTDMVARWGGDEFLVLLDGISRNDAAVAAGRIVEGLTFTVCLNGEELWLTASVGVSMFPDDAGDVHSLVNHADAAMYQAKRRGLSHGGYAFYCADTPPIGNICAGTDLTLKRADLSEPTAFPPAHYLDLREANEHLVMSSIEQHGLRTTAEEALHRQHDLVTVVAHELRNPLAPILAAVQSLGLVRPNAPSAPRIRAIIERQVAHMSRLVNDLLDMSRLTTGRFNLDKRIVDLVPIVDTAIESCGHLVRSRGQFLTMSKPKNVLKINADAVRLAKAFNNLTDNASKYTPEGGTILIDVKVQAGSAVLTVSDTGIGITADTLPYVFEPFLQDRHAVAFNGVGLGIGLSVVRELIVAHGGTVTAHSEGRGTGSSFVVTLPLAEDPTA
jgi:diguanylate cyclase (GGDEF)-like protein